MLTRSAPMRRTALKSKPRPGLTRDVVDAVLERDQHSCVVCGTNLRGERGRDWSIHHRRPRRMGGDPRPETNQPANLVAVCGSGTSGCHGWLESRRTEAMDQGLILHADDIPSEHPIGTWYGVVYLDDEGTLWPA